MRPTDDLDTYVAKLACSYTFFIEELWRDRSLTRVGPLGDVELDIANFAAYGPPDTAPGSRKYRGILANRGLGKTHIAVAALACFRLFRDPQRKIIVSSKTDTEAKKTVSLIREWLANVWFLQHLVPAPGQLDAAKMFDVTGATPHRQPSLTAIGIDGMLEGNRAHSIFADDIETDTNTKSPDARQDLDNRVKEYKDILYPDLAADKGGPVDPVEIVIVGTYHHEESVYLKLSERGYVFRTWTIAYPEPGHKILNLAPLLSRRLASGEARPGQPTAPYHFDETNIIEKQAEGWTRFAMQHMLIADLGDSNRYPLRLSDLVVMGCHRDKAPTSVAYGTSTSRGSTENRDVPHDGFNGGRLYAPVMIDDKWSPYTGTKAWIDPAGRGADYTGLSIVGQLHGYLWLKCCHGLEGGSSIEDMETLVRLCRTHGARDIYVESNADTLDTYRPLFEAVLRRHYLEPGEDPAYPEGWKATLVHDTKITHNTGQKEVRIVEAIEPVLSTHRMIADPSALHQEGQPREAQLWYQLSRMTRQRKCLKEDGKADSLAGCIRAWSRTLATDPAKARQRYAEREFDELLKEHMRAAGRTTKEPSWIPRR